MKSWATDKDDKTIEPRWGKVGKQKIQDTGPLTKKRMETCDDEFVAASKDFIKRQNAAGKPFFVWLNTTHMHAFTHTKAESVGQAGRFQNFLVWFVDFCLMIEFVGDLSFGLGEVEVGDSFGD